MTARSQDGFNPARRAMLGAAAGAAAAIAAAALPATTLAADPNDVVKDTDNATTALTSITQGTTNAGAFAAHGNGSGAGVVGTTDGTEAGGVIGTAGPVDGSWLVSGDPLDTGLYGYASQTGVSSGVFGEGPTGVYAFGDYGVYADGGTVGVFGSGYPDGTGVHAHTGTGTAPAPAPNTALLGTVTSRTQIGIHAQGRVVFPHRSGRVTFSAGQASKAVTVTGVTSSNFALAVLNTNRTGIYVRAVVPASGKITIYLNKAPTSSTSVAWLVLG